MKRLVFSLVLSFSYLLVSSSCFGESIKKKDAFDKFAGSFTTSNIGRYQIIPVEYVAIGQHGEYSQKAIIKLDTISGETWVF
jgi:hypothetical protein